MERGFDASTSTVTVVAAENPHNINDHAAISVMATLPPLSLRLLVHSPQELGLVAKKMGINAKSGWPLGRGDEAMPP